MKKLLAAALSGVLTAGIILGGTGLSTKAAETETETRSEERRVGKECRSRWSPYH